MRALIIQANNEIHQSAIPTALDARLAFLKETVGGFLEIVPLDNDLSMVLNDEAKLRSLNMNYIATLMAQEAQSIQSHDYIAGVAVIIPKLAML